MSTHPIDGRAVAADLRAAVAREVHALRAAGLRAAPATPRQELASDERCA
jgi:hypothetical protein